MNKQNIVFVYRNLVIGGIQSLLIRLSDALIANNYSVTIYYNSIYENGENDYIGRGVKLAKYEGFCPNELNKIDEIQSIITFEAEVYIKLVINNHRFNKDKDKIYLYSVHPYTFEYFYDGVKYDLFRKLFHKTFYNFVKNSVEAGFVFFMDEQCLNSTSKEYSINVDKITIDDYILRIIMQAEDNYSLESRNQSEVKILTVTRSDFPFKGYVKGLIETCASLLDEGYNLFLTIITSGNQKDKLNEWCSDLKNVKIIEDVNYDKLSAYYRNSDIYIGMGTTVLEAASEGIITIPVSPYTYECNSHGIFSDKPNWVLTEIGEGKPVKELLKKLISLSEVEKKELQKRMVDSVTDLYGTNNVINRLKIILDKNLNTKYQYKILPLSYIWFLSLKKLAWKIIKGRKKNGK